MTILLTFETVKAEATCAKINDTKYLECKLSGRHELIVGFFLNESMQNLVDVLTIGNFTQLIHGDTNFVKFTNLQKIVFKNTTGVLSNNRTLFNQKITYIEITTSDLDYVGDLIFAKLKDVRTLKVNKNKIRNIHKDAFKDLVKVEKMEMDQNNIESLDDELFVNNLELKTFSCQNNKIKRLTSKLFAKWFKVSYIQFQNNWINEIDKNFVKNSHSLIKMNLSGNICVDLNFNLTLQNPTWTSMEFKLKQCFYNYDYNQELDNIIDKISLKIINNNLTTVNSTDVEVIKSVNELEHTVAELRESKTKHQYFIYFMLFLLTALVIYGYLFIYRRFYHKLPIIRYNNSESSIQLL